jgi:hypothetical protein
VEVINTATLKAEADNAQILKDHNNLRVDLLLQKTKHLLFPLQKKE